jgi:hypothetical protein
MDDLLRAALDTYARLGARVDATRARSLGSAGGPASSAE